MQQVEYIGVVIIPRTKALGGAAAMRVGGSHFLDGSKNHGVLDRSDLDHLTSCFTPIDVKRPLSGLWHLMCGDAGYRAREYREPLCWVRLTKWGLLIGSDRGDVEAACRIINHLISGPDRATLWWSDLHDPSFWGTIHLSAGGASSVVSDDQHAGEKACGQANMQSQLLDDRRLLLDLALSIGPSLS